MMDVAADHIPARRWPHASAPRRILAIRFQGLGDTMIAMPYLLGVRRRFPDAELHFLTRQEVAAVPRAMTQFDRVIALGGDRDRWRTWLSALRHTPALLAGGRDIDALLHRHGWKSGFELVVLNPAGFSPARAWPTASYIEFARRWMERHPRSQIVLLLMPSKRARAAEISAALGEHCVDLTGHADQLEAFAIAGRARLVLSEDSGLMHMAWIQGTPTLALFSDSRRDWSAPQGSWSDCLDSSDLPCGPCGLEVCKFGDNRCLTRHSAAQVLERAEKLARARPA